MRLFFQTLLCAGLPVIVACHRDDRTGPPTLRLGRDECAECGMTIHEERSAAAILVDRNGRSDYLLFDDIGCLLDTERSKGNELKVVARFVHDQAGSDWVRGDDAVFLATDGSKLHTPMASGLAAYADRTGAGNGQRQYGGEMLDFNGLAEWRRQQVEQRRGRPGG